MSLSFFLKVLPTDFARDLPPPIFGKPSRIFDKPPPSLSTSSISNLQKERVETNREEREEEWGMREIKGER